MTDASHRPDRLDDVLAEVEHQAAALSLEDRAWEVRDLAAERYAAVTLESRFAASLRRQVTLTVGRGDAVTGVVTEVGSGWVLLETPGAEALVRLESVSWASGLTGRAQPAQARGVDASLGWATMLRRWEGEEVSLRLADGRQRAGRLGRIGADFVELLHGGSDADLVATRAIEVCRR